MNLDLVFFNQCFDKRRLKAVISWCCKNLGEKESLKVIEEFKKMGFNNATQAGISIGINDLKTPPLKPFLVSEAEFMMNSTHQEYKGARITYAEKSQRIIDTWHRASEILRKQIVDYFASTDEFNPVYIMALSGARGNFSQVRQLVGMRGLMADPQGQIISFPIRSNFREGLTLTEYFISCSGARKGLVDTALRTADTGYLTRRLVDVSHHVVVKRVACETNRGIFLKPIYSGKKMLLSLKERLIGRVLARDIPSVVKQDQEITPELAFKLASLNKAILVRSPLTCSFHHDVCQLCYGWSPSQGNLVSLGEAVGVIAAQSIGEPGTQLTMRTFHTGGVFSGDLLEAIKAPADGKIMFSSAFPGLLIRSAHGKIAFLTKVAGEMILTLSLTPPEGECMPDPDTSELFLPELSSGSQAPLDQREAGGVALLRHKKSPDIDAPSSTIKEKDRFFKKTNSDFSKNTNLKPVSSQDLSSKNSPKHRQHDKTLTGMRESGFENITPERVEIRIPFQTLTMLFVRQGEYVKKNQILGEFSILGEEGNQPIKSKQTLFAEFSGKIMMFSGGKKKSGEEEERIQPEKSGKLGFFFVLAATLGATLGESSTVYASSKHSLNSFPIDPYTAKLWKGREGEKNSLKELDFLNTIAEGGDLVDSDYRKLQPLELYQNSLEFQFIPYASGSNELLIKRGRTKAKHAPPKRWRFTKQTTRSEQCLSLIHTHQTAPIQIPVFSTFLRDKEVLYIVEAKTSKKLGLYSQSPVQSLYENEKSAHAIKNERIINGTVYSLKKRGEFVFRWTRSLSDLSNPKINSFKKQLYNKEKSDTASIIKTQQSLVFSTCYQNWINKRFPLIFFPNLQSQSIPFFSNFNAWITITDASRFSTLSHHTSKMHLLMYSENITKRNILQTELKKNPNSSYWRSIPLNLHPKTEAQLINV